MRTSSAVSLLVLLAACGEPPVPAPVVRLAETADTLIVPVVQLTAARPLSDGRWVMIATNEVELQVADDGPGIADADKQKVFERFHAIPNHRRSADQAGSAQPSSGLGLAIVQSIAHAHSGQTLVRDNLPQGVVLIMRWPITTPPAP